MCYVPEKFKLNKFTLVNIPSNRSYFGRYGLNSVPASAYSGEQDPAPSAGNKTDTLALMAERDRVLQQEEDNK